MSKLDKFIETAKSFTKKYTPAILVTCTLGSVLFGNVENASAQYLQIDNITPSNRHNEFYDDYHFAPSFGGRAQKAWLSNDDYTGFYVTGNTSILFQDSYQNDINMEFLFSLDANLGFTPHLGIRGGLFSDHSTNIKHDSDRQDPNHNGRVWDNSLGLSAATYVRKNCWEFCVKAYYSPINVSGGENELIHKYDGPFENNLAIAFSANWNMMAWLNKRQAKAEAQANAPQPY